MHASLTKHIAEHQGPADGGRDVKLQNADVKQLLRGEGCAWASRLARCTQVGVIRHACGGRWRIAALRRVTAVGVVGVGPKAPKPSAQHHSPCGQPGSRGQGATRGLGAVG